MSAPQRDTTPTRWRVLAPSGVSLRADARAKAQRLAGLPQGAILYVDLIQDYLDNDTRVGYDDPATPEPARTSSAWLRVVAYQATPTTRVVALRTPAYVALEWCEEVRG